MHVPTLLQLAGKDLKLALHFETRSEGAGWFVLVSIWGAEECQQAIAGSLFTEPPCWSITATARPRQSLMISVTISGSIRSDIAVKPAISAKRTVTVRRSPSIGAAVLADVTEGWLVGGTTGATAAGVAAPVSTSAVPHSLQNLAVAAFGNWQLGQVRGKRAPHSLQNFAVVGFSDWHASQRTNALLTRDVSA